MTQPQPKNAPSPLSRGDRPARPGRFIFGRALLVIVTLAVVAILAPFTELSDATGRGVRIIRAGT